MNRCLACGKPLTPDDTFWHTRCVKSFFGTKELPTISLDSEALEVWGSESTRVGFTVPGVQKKLSLHLEAYRGKGKLTLNGHPPGYILKLQADEYPHLPELEDVVMRMADVASLETVPHALLRSEDGTLAYISKRIDRIQTKERIQKLPMEDFCQLSLRLTEDKYKGSYEQCGQIIRRYSSQPMLDLTNFWYLLVFCFITGNSDMHLKNFSLYAPTPSRYQLTPAYDLLPVALVLPQDPDETALTLRGKRSRLTLADFLSLADHLQLAPKVAERLIARLIKHSPDLLEVIETSWLTAEEKMAMKELLISRLDRLQ